MAGLVLAAGRGSRFPSEPGSGGHSRPFPKVLRQVLRKPMIEYVLDALRGAGVTEITLVVGFGAEEVKCAVGPGVEYVMQPEQKGSGHAVACARKAFAGYAGELVVMCGDSPLFTADTVRRLVSEHNRASAAATLASAILADPFGYGRIVRGADGAIEGIVEEACADEPQRAISEVNGGLYCFDARWLFENIDKMAINAAGEYNLTDMVRVAVEQGRSISAVECDPTELLGVNTPEQLGAVEAILQSRE